MEIIVLEKERGISSCIVHRFRSLPPPYTFLMCRKQPFYGKGIGRTKGVVVSFAE